MQGLHWQRKPNRLYTPIHKGDRLGATLQVVHQDLAGIVFGQHHGLPAQRVLVDRDNIPVPRIAISAGGYFVTSEPRSSGALTIAHHEKCARAS